MASAISMSCGLLWNALSGPPLKQVQSPCSGLCPKPSRGRVVVVRAEVNRGASESKWVTKGVITESLPNGMFWVRIENGDVVLGYISGKIRRNSIRMLAGDQVKIEVSRYDSTRGRIVYRIGNNKGLNWDIMSRAEHLLTAKFLDQNS